MEYAVIRQRIDELSRRFASDRSRRQRRTSLAREDFDGLRQAGYPLVVVPVEDGGAFVSMAKSVRPLCEILRSLAAGDSSVALVCAMHPAVLSQWLTPLDVPAEYVTPWQQQRKQLFAAARAGSFFGTITSEPGSGGDINLTRSIARKVGDGYVLDGQKHFGSGMGMTSFMVTTAIPEGDSEPDWYLLDVRDTTWDGAQGMKLIAQWEGCGMIATQSHAMSFSSFPAVRCAWPGVRRQLGAASTPFVLCLFAAVTTGIVDAAIDVAQAQRAARKLPLRPYEQVEWARAEIDAWLVRQALEGMLRAAEAQPTLDREITQGKVAISELAESCLQRLCRVAGGGSFSRQSALGNLFEDVRALGFLRPPWGLAFDSLIPPAT